MQTETNGTPARRGLAIEEFDKKILEMMSPKERPLGLGQLVEEKRWRYGIPDAAFYGQFCGFQRVHVAQIPEQETETYAGTSIIKTEITKKRELVEAARGVIVSAGLGALDILRSNGFDIGHTVAFVRLAPFRRWVNLPNGIQIPLISLVAGDIIDSEDLGEMLRTRKVRIVPRVIDGMTQHCFVDENGKSWNPVEVDMPEDA